MRGAVMLGFMLMTQAAFTAEPSPEDERARRIKQDYQEALATEAPEAQAPITTEADQRRVASMVSAAAAKREADEEIERAKKRQSAKAAAMKQKCGGDYNRARVGMSFARVKECSSGKYLLKLEQLTPDGEVLRGYQKGNIYLHVVADKVVRAVVL